MLQLFEVAADTFQKGVLMIDDSIIGLRCMIEYGCTVLIDERGLMLKQGCILRVRFSSNVNGNQGFITNRNHIVESKKAVTPTGKLEDMLAGLNVFMIAFGRFHWDEILKSTNKQYNANIGATLTLVVLNTYITTMQKGNIFLLNTIDS